jgi:hypothetical protein
MEQIIIYVTAGLAAGFLAGLLGVGGGILLVPIFHYLLRLPMHVAVGSSLGVIIFTSIAGTFKHWQANNVDVKLVIAVAVFSIIGSYFGALVCEKMSPDLLKRIFAVILIITAIKMLT